MRIIRHLPDSADSARAVAIGNFDGLHRGHQAVIGAMVEAAKAHDAVPSVLTFEPHPRRFFQKDVPAFRIERLKDKFLHLESEGVAQVVVPRFNRAFATLEAQDFLDFILLRKLGAKAVVTGENFAFGRGRTGDSAMLKAWGDKHNVEIITVPPVMVDAEVCSSSAVRSAILKGDISGAKKFLGHDYRLTGRVVRGEQRGRTIGFPTANLALARDLLLPAYGVYAVWVVMDGKLYEGVANLGVRPTVAVDSCPSFEVYVFDTLQEMYGKTLSVTLVHKLRDEMKFEGVEQLKAQIARDCEAARLVLARNA